MLIALFSEIRGIFGCFFYNALDVRRDPFHFLFMWQTTYFSWKCLFEWYFGLFFFIVVVVVTYKRTVCMVDFMVIHQTIFASTFLFWRHWRAPFRDRCIHGLHFWYMLLIYVSDLLWTTERIEEKLELVTITTPTAAAGELARVYIMKCKKEKVFYCSHLYTCSSYLFMKRSAILHFCVRLFFLLFIIRLLCISIRRVNNVWRAK